jgi:hypothetical protein
VSDAQISGWAPIVGRWEPAERQAVYLGPMPDQKPPFGICVSNVAFSGGEARTTVRFASSSNDGVPKEAGRVLLGYRSPEQEYLTVGLGGYDRAYCISRYDNVIGWRGLALAGHQQNLKTGHPYQIGVRVEGQRVTLVVDGVRVLEHILQSPLPEGQFGLFAWGEDKVEFTDIAVSPSLGTAFVVMQLADGIFDELYKDVIIPVAKEFHLRAYHAGDVFGPGAILEDIVGGIIEAKIIIAEITPPNQNVFYELGYAHALRKPTILLAERGKPLPFDVSGYRVLFYENSIGGKAKLEQGLRKHLESIRAES